MADVSSIRAREILDSRGNPTLEVDVQLADGAHGRAAVPSGASTGSREAIELRDGDKERYGGKGVLRAVYHVNGEIRGRLLGVSVDDQAMIDRMLIELDGTANKARLGANAILGVSLAVARAAACSLRRPLFQHLGGSDSGYLPVPLFNVLNGGVHADNSVDPQEFMIAPVGASSFSDALRIGATVYQALKATLKQQGYSTAVGDEGGFAPSLRSNVEAIEVILEATSRAGLRAPQDIVLALDPAASEFFENGRYVFRKSDKSSRSPAEMVAFWESWVGQYPILSIEDGVAENDEVGWRLMTEKLGTRIQLVGDDNFVTNPALIRKGIREGIANSVLIKLNQIGTLTETLQAVDDAHAAGYSAVISHRSGETSDDFIADFAVATRAGQIKTGAPCRGERVAKYNQLLRIEEELGSGANYAGRQAFSRFLPPGT